MLLTLNRYDNNQREASVNSEGLVMKKQTMNGICVCFLGFSFLFGMTGVKTHAAEPVAVESVLLQDINNVRALHGLQPLSLDDTLNAGAHVRAGEIMSCFSHTRPDGTPWYTVDYDHIYGETLGRGYTRTSDGAHNIVSMWMNSPSHASLLLQHDYRTVGFAVRQSASGGCYWAAELGY